MQGSVQSPPQLVPFGKYLLDAEIARGGMARVYLARLRGLGGFEKKLVVKQVLPELASDPRFVELFVEEAKTVVQMSHPHIVPVYELGIVDGVYFLAMEYVDGATLAEILRASGPLAPALAAHLGAQLCDALAYAHSRFGLVHRDVTPRNAIVDALGHARLLDFGIAARAEGEGSGELFGSHGYMSPEQASGEPLGPATDLFSLGAVLYEALTNEPAFLRDTNEATRAALFDEPVRSLAGRDEIPAELAAIVDGLLARDPVARPSSAAQVGQRLRGFVAQLRPEGVAPELGARAADAMERRGRTASQRPPGAARSGAGGGRAETIATSVTLRRLLDEAGPETASAGERSSGPAPAGTVPIDGRAEGRDPAETQAGTVPIEGRRSIPSSLGDAAATSVATAGPREPRRPASPAPGAQSRVAVVLGALFLGVVALFVAQSLFFEEGLPRLAARLAEQVSEQPSDLAPEPDVAPEPAEVVGPEVTDVEPARPPEAAPEPGYLRINAYPWAEYTLDRRRLGNRPVRNLQVSAGRHVLHYENPSLGQGEARIDVPPGATLEITIDLNTDPPSVRIDQVR